MSWLLSPSSATNTTPSPTSTPSTGPQCPRRRRNPSPSWSSRLPALALSVEGGASRQGRPPGPAAAEGGQQEEGRGDEHDRAAGRQRPHPGRPEPYHGAHPAHRGGQDQ